MPRVDEPTRQRTLLAQEHRCPCGERAVDVVRSKNAPLGYRAFCRPCRLRFDAERRLPKAHETRRKLRALPLPGQRRLPKVDE